MKGHPPQHQHFRNKKIPAHITFAYKEGVKILKNDDFYNLPDGVHKEVDLLFLIANAPVSMAGIPEGGSESYVGLAVAMELATTELAERFPLFFDKGRKAPKQKM